MTGWGQTGPYAQAAGHDINYIALSGVLHTIGVAGAKPVPPVNYVGDFGGGGMFLAFGMVAGLLAVKNGAPGQVIDVAMTDGSALLAGMSYAMLAAGTTSDVPGTNLLDGGAPFYDSYACADGKWIAIGSIEPQVYALLRDKLGIADDPAFDAQFDKAAWPARKERLAAIFAALVVVSCVGRAALFALPAVILPKRALVASVAAALVVEYMAGFLPAVINQLTVSLRLRSLLVRWMGWERALPTELQLLVDTQPAWVQIMAVVALASVMLFAAGVILARRQFPPAEEA
jgi:crotonobetainyl-CoA:carnitine CoA-transferase CaiB-like acyl-CoA transferase